MDRWVKRWTVPSQSTPGVTYVVAQDRNGDWGCSCPAWVYHRKMCKHIRSVQGSATNYDVYHSDEPYVLVYGFCQECKKKDDIITVPMMPNADEHQEVTVVYDLLKMGVSIESIQKHLKLPASFELPPNQIVGYVQYKGRKIFDHQIGGKLWVGSKVIEVPLEG